MSPHHYIGKQAYLCYIGAEPGHTKTDGKKSEVTYFGSNKTLIHPPTT